MFILNPQILVLTGWGKKSLLASWSWPTIKEPTTTTHRLDIVFKYGWISLFLLFFLWNSVSNTLALFIYIFLSSAANAWIHFQNISSLWLIFVNSAPLHWIIKTCSCSMHSVALINHFSFSDDSLAVTS